MNDTTMPRLLIIRNDRVGDLLLSLPALEYARKVFPETEISVLASSRTASLLRGNAHVDRVLLDDGKSSARVLGAQLRQHVFDAAIAIFTNTRNCLAVWHAGIPLRVAWAHKPVGLLLGNRRVWIRRSHPPIHETEFALAFVRRLRTVAGVPLFPPSITVDPDALRRVELRIRSDLGDQGPCFGVHPGSYGSTYNWPAQRYLELASQLAAYGRVVVTGGPGEREMLADMQAQLVPGLRSRVAFYHEFDLQELAAAISQLDVLTVSNTGPMHLAGVLGTPLVALFSAHPAHSAAKWEPFGQRKTILQAPLLPGERAEIPPGASLEHMCRISVDEVVQANLAHLQHPRVRQSA